MIDALKLLAVVLVLCVSSVTALAAGEIVDEAEIVISSESGSLGTYWAKAIAVACACFGAGLAAVGGGLAIARIGSTCIESIARQPEAGGAMFAPMVIVAAMVETGMLFAISVCLITVLFF